MWADIYSSSVIFVSHTVVKLKREAKSLELGIQIFIIILVTVSKSVFTGSVVHLMHVTRHIFKRLIQIPSTE